MFFLGLRNLPLLSSADWYEKLPRQALRSCSAAERRRRRPVEKRSGSAVPITGVPRRCCDSADMLRGEEGGRAAGVHLLTCSICLFFLAEWVDGGLSPATAPHGNKQRQFFSLLRAARYERENGTATSAAGRRTDHPCQTEFGSISVATTPGRTSGFQKQLTTRGGFFSGWGRRLKTDRHFWKHQFAAGHLGAHGNNVYQQFPAIKLQDLSQITCAESPFNFSLPTNAAKPPLSRITGLHARSPDKRSERWAGPSITTAGAAEKKKTKRFPTCAWRVFACMWNTPNVAWSM